MFGPRNWRDRIKFEFSNTRFKPTIYRFGDAKRFRNKGASQSVTASFQKAYKEADRMIDLKGIENKS